MLEIFLRRAGFADELNETLGFLFFSYASKSLMSIVVLALM
jgi:hypothetical protein